MTSVTHTGGPWTSERDLPRNRMPRVHGGDQSLICEVGNMGTRQDQWDANARLIASAPNLLSALSAIVGSLNVASDNPNVPDNFLVPIDMTMGELRKARAAIAQAKEEAA